MKELQEFIDRETDFEQSQKRIRRTTSPVLASLFPKEEGGVFENRFLIFPFSPGNFAFFKGILSPNLITLQLGLRVHFISVEDKESGEIENKMVLCPEGTNGAFRVIYRDLTIGEFKGNCPICTYAQAWWDQFNERKKEMGLKGLSVEEYRDIIQKDEALRTFRAEAKKLTSMPRYIFVVFDIDRFEGRKPLGEDEFCEYQILFAPRTIFDAIAGFVRSFNRAGLKFWGIESPHVVSIIRDTREGFPGVKYSVSVEPKPYKLTPELKAYLEKGEIPDPSPFINSWNEVFVIEAVRRIDTKPEGTREIEIKKDDMPKDQTILSEKVKGEDKSTSRVPISGVPLSPKPKLPDQNKVTAEEVIREETPKTEIKEEKKEEKIGTPIRRRLKF